MKPLPYLTLSLALLLLGCAEKPKTVETVDVKKTEKKPVVLTLSPETTYLTEPQLPDGRIDYIAALNKKLSAQTTPENNLIVGIFSLVLGEDEEKILHVLSHGLPETEEGRKVEENRREYREQFWKLLGADLPLLDSLAEITPISLGKNYEERLLEFYSREELAPLIEQQRELDKEQLKARLEGGVRVCCGRVFPIEGDGMTQEQYEAELKRIESETPDSYYRSIVQEQWRETLRRPWTAEEFPYLAHWMATTDDWTPKLIDISRQYKGFYHPLISDSPLTYTITLPYVQSLRQSARFFHMRGNFEFAQGHFDQAKECAFSAVRMGRTIRTGACTLVEDLIGVAIAGMGKFQLTTYLAALPEEKDAAWILQKKKEYDAIIAEFGQLPPLPIWHLGERAGTLSYIQAIAVEPKTAHEFFKSYNDEALIAKYEKLFDSDMEHDWDEIMRQVNSFYDDMEEMLLIPNQQRRLRATARLDQRGLEYSKRNIDSDATPERKATDFLLGNLAPSVEPAMIALTRAEWDSRVTSVAFALAAYRADNGGESPDTLEQLVPHYLDKVPTSPFTDLPLRYLKRENDVLIANDETYQLDGSEEDVEKLIADAKPGVRVFPAARSFMLVVSKK